MDTKIYKLKFFSIALLVCLVIHTCDYRGKVYFTIMVSKETCFLAQTAFFIGV